MRESESKGDVECGVDVGMCAGMMDVSYLLDESVLVTVW